MAMSTIQFRGDGLDFTLGKLAGHILNHLLLFGELEIHVFSSGKKFASTSAVRRKSGARSRLMLDAGY
jgi:hypothetical protein